MLGLIRHLTVRFTLVDGNYSNWIKSLPCSVTCGEGVETWMRQCDNPLRKYSENCSSRGSAQENRLCKMKPCPGKFGNFKVGRFLSLAYILKKRTCSWFCSPL